MKKRNSIFTKVFLLASILSILTAIIITGLAVKEQSDYIEKSLVRENKMLVEEAVQSIESNYLINQWPFAVLKHVSESKDVLFLLVIKPNGEIYMTDKPDMWGKKISNMSFMKEGVKDALYNNTSERIKIITHSINIDDSGEPWSLCVGVSLKSIDIAKNKMIAKAIVVVSIILIAVTIAAFYFAQSIILPLKKLTEAAGKIARGNLNYKIKVKSKDEVGELAKALDKMRISLKSRNTLLNSILTTFSSKFGNAAIALLRMPIKKVVVKDSKILDVLPKKIAKSITKELERK